MSENFKVEIEDQFPYVIFFIKRIKTMFNVKITDFFF